MISGKTCEETVWLTDGKKTFSFRERKTHTMTAFGDKTEFIITVFHSPMQESIDAVKSRVEQPSRKQRMEKAVGIVNHIESLITHLIKSRFQKA